MCVSWQFDERPEYGMEHLQALYDIVRVGEHLYWTRSDAATEYALYRVSLLYRLAIVIKDSLLLHSRVRNFVESFVFM